MRLGFEASGGWRAHSPSWRIGSSPLGMLAFEGLQFPKQTIELCVVDFRPIFDVVEPIVPV
jgi:hypothetical protein